MRTKIPWTFLILIFLHSFAFPTIFENPQKLLSTLSLDQKIGQLFMIAAVSSENLNTDFMEYTPYHVKQEYIESLITTHHVGGIIFLGAGTIQSQYLATQRFQSLSHIPLLIGQDCEWGVAMRLQDAPKFPYAITLGAIDDMHLIYQTGLIIGKHCSALGIHINFAPVADINTNPFNPVIGYRSFGNNSEIVSRACAAFTQGLHDADVMACAKHFPGHGDTAVDSHYKLPVLEHDIEHLRAIELLPFRHLLGTGIPAIMTGHLASPALDHSGNAASISRRIVTDFLRQELGFAGLIFTDGLGMRAITHTKQPGQPELEALLAGNDILLCPVDVPAACTLIKQALADGRLSHTELDAKVLKILRTKQTYVQTHSDISPDDIQTIIQSPEVPDLQQQLFQAAITLVTNHNTLVPISINTHVTHLEIGSKTPSHFARLLNQHYDVLHISEHDPSSLSNLQLPEAPLIISVHGMSKYTRDRYSMSVGLVKTLNDLMLKHPTSILILFGNPYSTLYFPDAPCLLCGYEDVPQAHSAMVEIICGKRQPKGRLPI